MPRAGLAAAAIFATLYVAVQFVAGGFDPLATPGRRALLVLLVVASAGLGLTVADVSKPEGR